jgi:hypothetical protein
MIHYKGLLLATLLWSTTATSLRGLQETELGTTLGDAFLTAADIDNSDTKPTVETSTNINAQMEADKIPEIGNDFRALCNKNGYVESDSSSYGPLTSYPYANINCRVPTSLLDVILSATLAMLDEAEGAVYDTSTSSYINSYNPASLLAQKKGLEELLRLADTIEQVMLIIPAWQNIVSQLSPATNTSTVYLNLNQKYDDPGYQNNFTSSPEVMRDQGVGMMKHSAGDD